MLKTISLFGLLTMTAMAGIAFVGMPPAGRVLARDTKPRVEASCAVVDVALDEGYGLTKHARETVCGK